MFFESDLYFLQQLFFPNARYVALLDPEHEVKQNWESGFLKVDDQNKLQEVAKIKEGLVVFNMTNIPVHRYPFLAEAIEGIVHFGKKGEFFGDFTRDTFYYIRNDIETLRWVYPNNLRKAFFLRFYDNDAAYSFLFQGFSALAGLFRQIKWIADGKFYVLHKGELFFDNLDGVQYDSYTLFLKDMFYSGKGLLQLIRDDQIVYYAKYPITEKAQQKTDNEYQVLKQLNQYDFRNLRISSVQEADGFLLLSNAMTLKHKTFYKLKKQHFKAVGEYTRQFAREVTLEDWLKEEKILDHLAYLKASIENDHVPKGISAQNLANLYKVLTDTLNDLPLAESIHVSLVHGDFTEENMSIEADCLILLDWKFAHFNAPALSDFWEFAFFRMEEDKRPEMANFIPIWERITRQEPFQAICTEFAPNFFLQAKVYLIFKILHYCKRHLKDDFLPYYVNWRIYFWQELIKELNNENQALSPFQLPQAKALEENGEKSPS